MTLVVVKVIRPLKTNKKKALDLVHSYFQLLGGKGKDGLLSSNQFFSLPFTVDLFHDFTSHAFYSDQVFIICSQGNINIQ